jgi:wyosine [tRNA(Phe)-imidazoG37] synthetase (radical SAM superfamily)
MARRLHEKDPEGVMHHSWNQQVEELVESVSQMESAHRGRLVALTLAVPHAPPPETVVEWVLARLRAIGLASVEVQARPEPGPLRIVSVEFAR